MLNTEILKKDFPVLELNPRFSYLDSAATSQTPASVITMMQDYYERYRSNVHRGLYEFAEEATQAYEDARKTVAGFINAEPGEVIFTAGATGSMNMLARMLEHSDFFEEGDEIVTSVMEHHAMLIPLQEVAKRNKCVLKFIPLGADYTLDMNAYEKLLTKKTKLVGITMASNVLGTIVDVREATARAHKVGARVIVDAAKAAGHLPIDVRGSDGDFIFFSGHKMCGPTGIGVLYGKKELLEELEPGNYGGGIVRSVKKESAEYLPPPERFEAGTPPIAEAIGLAEAVRYLGKIGIENVHKHVSALAENAWHALKEIEGVTAYTAKENCGVVSFSVEGIHAHDVAEICARHQVAVRAGHHCAAPLLEELGVKSLVRASFSLYNDEADIEKLVEAVKEAQKIFNT